MTTDNFESWSEDIFNSMQSASVAEAPSFIFTRIKSKIENRQTRWDKISYLLTKPAIAVTISAVIIALNFILIQQHLSNNKTQVQTDYVNSTITNTFELDNDNFIP